MEERRPVEDDEEVESGPVTHGGEGDPLGVGVADLKETPEVGEGVPEQNP